MRYEEEVYIQLYKMRIELLSQIRILEATMVNALPKDDKILDEVTNLVSLGYYDYPRKGNISDKITFALKMLGSANVDEIGKYLKILGEDEIAESELNKYLAKNSDNDSIIKYKKGITVKYKLTKS